MPLLKHKNLGKKTIIELSGAEMTSAEAKIIRKLRPAGVMFRRRNFQRDLRYEDWLLAYQKLQTDIKNEIDDSCVIFAVDHEGGKIIRFPPPITRFPYQFYWGDRLSQVASAMAVELKSLGINLLLGPVLDVWNNPLNRVIAERAFAKQPEQVAGRAAIFLKIFTELGITLCPKHFPGHGRAAEDSHFVLPTIDITLDELMACELLPFKMAIDYGAPSLMSAHLFFPKIDRLNPTTHSKILMVDLLRDELGFKGVLITDALAMGAVQDRLSDEFISKLSAAMVDIALFVGDDCHLEEAAHYAARLENLMIKDQKLAREVESSLERVDRFLSNIKNFACVKLPENILTEHNNLAESLSLANSLSTPSGMITDKF